MLEVQLLGEVKFLADGRGLRSPVGKPLAMIAYLALEGKTHRSLLAMLFWTHSTEPEARRNLRQELFRLQKTQLAPWLEVEDETVALRQPFETDVKRFLELLESNDLETALKIYSVLLKNLTLKDAPAFEEWLEVKRTTLSRVHRSALNRFALQLEVAGDLRGALRTQLNLLAGDELLEFHQREAMRLHALLGERSEALERYQRFRQLLAEELGLEPTLETSDLATKIRSGDTTITAISTPRAATNFSELPFVGREVWTEKLRQNNSKFVLILGEPGIGKTRLLEHFSTSSIWVRCSAASMQTPLAGIANTLQAILETELGKQRLGALSKAVRLEVARLVPALEPHFMPQISSAQQPEYRTRFLRSIAQALSVAAGENGTIVFDDLHWIDATSLEVLELLISMNSDLKILASARDFELSQHEGANTVLNKCSRLNQLERFELPPLNQTNLLEMVQTLKPDALEARVFTDDVFRLTAGNPLLAVQTITHRLENKNSTTLAPSLLEVIQARLEPLGAGVKRILEAASLTSTEFSLAMLSGASPLSEWEALEACETAVQARLFNSSEAGYKFSHDLVQRALNEQLNPERRRLLHTRLALTAQDLQLHPSIIATHLEGAQKAREAAVWRIRAADAAQAVYAQTEALEQYAKALTNGVTDPEAFEIHISRLRILKALRDETSVNTTFVALEEICERLNDARYNTRKNLIWAHTYMDFGRMQESLTRVEQVLEIPDLAPEFEVEARSKLGRILRILDRTPEAFEQLLLARAQIRFANINVHADINNALGFIYMVRGELEPAQHLILETLEVTRKAGNRRAQAIALSTQARLELMQSNHANASESLAQALKIAAEIGDVSLQLVTIHNAVRVHLEGGEFLAASQKLEIGLALAADIHEPDTERVLQHSLGKVQTARGNIAAALSASARAFELVTQIQNPDMALYCYNLVVLRSKIGDVLGARACTTHPALKDNETADFLLALSWCDLNEQLAGQAISRLEQLQSELGANFAEYQAKHACTLARGYLMLGNRTRALEILENLNLDIPPALLASILSVKLMAEKPAKPHTLENARTLLETKKLPPLETLELRHALVTTARLKPKELQAQQKELRRLTHLLAKTIPDELRLGFFEKWKIPDLIPSAK